MDLRGTVAIAFIGVNTLQLKDKMASNCALVPNV